ncbi:SurA N-terminal domain-containing protein [Streptomyces daqingensis]|uniref:SurA N-terminal domain-containing protein n=1 Tax=Streptomyces daqingensis TaxID=1472640 RepID=UPI0016662FC6|nr:SurA N-terminal domain-containing protein [Streptomyces daqingensis]
MHSSTQGSRRRRSVLTVCGAAALLVAAPLLTACGNDAHPGAAAVLGGERITVGELQAKVKEVRDAQREAPRGEEIIKGSGQLTRATLDNLIRDRIVKKAADDAGVSVTRREVGEARAQLEKQAGGSKKLKEALLQQQAIAPGDIDDRLRMQLAVDKIAKASGIQPGSPESNKALSEKFSKTSKSMHIRVNPRFGKWDVKQSVLGNRTEPWLQDTTGRQADRHQQQP